MPTWVDSRQSSPSAGSALLRRIVRRRPYILCDDDDDDDGGEALPGPCLGDLWATQPWAGAVAARWDPAPLTLALSSAALDAGTPLAGAAAAPQPIAAGRYGPRRPP